MIRSQRVLARNGQWRHTNEIELICADCGDDPELAYQEVTPRLRRVRGPYHTIEQAQAALAQHRGHNSRRERHAW
jgi:hypothetical protein